MPTRPQLRPSASLRRLVDLVNELGPPLEPTTDEAAAAAFAEVMRRHGDPEPIDFRADDLREPRVVFGQLYSVFAAADSDLAASRPNELLAEYGAPPRLTSEADSPWHLHVDRQPFAWDTWLGAGGAFALALLLASQGRPSWGVCSARGCGRFYVNDGAGRPRRACSVHSASRFRVAAHRARRAAAATGGADAIVS